MAAVENKPESLPTDRPVGGINGICPKCKKGELRAPVEGRYVSFRRWKQVESINRIVYHCNNPACKYENVAIVILM